MDEGNTELSDKLSDNVVHSNQDSSSNVQASTSVNAVTELPRSAHTHMCTHTHTCNQPGPDAATHTHTCYHTHTQVFASEDGDDRENTMKLRRPSGNREAVRKYRERKKAHNAYLEEEVKKLRLVNQQLVRKLEGQALLEAELSRLKRILANLKEKIDSELGAFPFEKNCNSCTSLLHTDRRIGLQCRNDSPCFHAHPQLDVCEYGKLIMIPLEGNCQAETVDCHVDANNMTSTDGQTVDTVDNFMSTASQDG